MTKQAVMDRIRPIFQDVFDDASLIVTEETCAADIEDWDSLAQISLVVAMEHEFGLKFNLDEVNALENIGGMADLILAKLSEKGRV